MEQPVVELRHITKRFGALIANDAVDFDVRAGEVHALLGENGAGKTTLMNVLAGLYQPDGGEIAIRGRAVAFHSPRDALDRGIGMIHQHFQLVEPFTVEENLALACAQRLLYRGRDARHTMLRLCALPGLEVDPQARVWQLSVGERQRVEILKLLGRSAEILILDEPTAVLTPQESEGLFATLRRLASEGASIIFISHKLNEVIAVADRITVLRGGRVVATRPCAGATPRELARLMVGRDISLARRERSGRAGEPVLELDGVCAESDRGLRALDDVSLTVHAGEVVGVAGVAGNGQRELAEVVAGTRPATAGHVRLAGRELTNHGARAMIRGGLGFVPEDRLGTGLVPDLAVLENLMLKQYDRPPLARGMLINRRAARRWAHERIDGFSVRFRGLGAPVRQLSGGNQQKLILAREMGSDRRLLVAMHPTRGLDVGATEQVHRLLLQQRAEGSGLLLISEDLDEIMALADRIAVLYGGRIMAVLPAPEADRETIGLLMGGHTEPLGVA